MKATPDNVTTISLFITHNNLQQTSSAATTQEHKEENVVNLDNDEANIVSEECHQPVSNS